MCMCDFIKMISRASKNNRALQGVVSHLKIRMFISHIKLIATLAVVLDVA